MTPLSSQILEAYVQYTVVWQLAEIRVQVQVRQWGCSLPSSASPNPSMVSEPPTSTSLSLPWIAVTCKSFFQLTHACQGTSVTPLSSLSSMRGSISSQCHYWLRALQPRSSCHIRGAITISHHEFFHLKLARGYVSTSVQQLQRRAPLWRLVPARELNMFSVFSKEARAKEKARLQDELNRGYFDDFREMKRTGGKIALASTSLTPVAGSVRFPALEVCVPKVGPALTLPAEGFNATLVCMAFRASAQPMVLSWSSPFAQKFSGSTSCSVFEVSVIESAVLSLSPVKWLLLRTMRGSQISEVNGLERKVVYAFGDTYEFRKVLGIPNLLSGYALLVDRKGRVRWRASGMAMKEELESMVTCTTRLLQEETSKAT